MRKLEPVFINKGKYNQRHIGDIDRIGKIFYKQVISYKHKFRVLDAYGIDSYVLNNMLLKKNYTIRLEEVDTMDKYKTTAKEFIEKGKYYHFKEEQLDHSTQIFLPLKEWYKLTEEDKEKELMGYI